VYTHLMSEIIIGSKKILLINSDLINIMISVNLFLRIPLDGY
jgi:hypothetical protein